MMINSHPPFPTLPPSSSPAPSLDFPPAQPCYSSTYSLISNELLIFLSRTRSDHFAGTKHRLR
eukprot:389016-Hanusia_phi.AAC.1